MSESISKNNELENEMTLDMSYFWYSDNIWWSANECNQWRPSDCKVASIVIAKMENGACLGPNKTFIMFEKLWVQMVMNNDGQIEVVDVEGKAVFLLRAGILAVNEVSLLIWLS